MNNAIKALLLILSIIIVWFLCMVLATYLEQTVTSKAAIAVIVAIIMSPTIVLPAIIFWWAIKK